MIYLLFSVLSSTILLLTFKFAEKLSVDIFRVVVINYFVAAILGILLDSSGTNILSFIETDWFLGAVLLGVLFIIMFNVIGYSAQKIGITGTSIANRMSMIIPISFSIFYYDEGMHFWKGVGIVLAVLAVFLTVYRKQKGKIDVRFIYLPLALFFGGGFIDTIVKYMQEEYINPEQLEIFSSFIFAISGIIGVVLSVVKRLSIRSFLRPQVLGVGAVLGVFNFGSLFFIVLALEENYFDSSIVFAINSVAILGLAILFSRILFNEKLTTINWAGVILSFLTIIIFTWS